MEIQLFSMTSEKNRLGKSKTALATITGSLRNQCNILTPSIVIEYLPPTSFNYFYIPEFSRYYFVTNITYITNSIVEITGSVDVLDSYEQQIRANSGVIQRQENIYNLDLYDKSFLTQQNTQLQVKQFPRGFNRTPQLVLATF